MNTMQQGIVTLLKSAVTQQGYPLPAGFDLEEAYPQVKQHHMDALIYEGAVLCGISRQMPLMKQLFQNYCKLLMISEGQMREVDRLFRAFNENGIDYLPLKGCKMKALYPKPELRTMGDADILIRMEQYDRIKPLMETMGYQAGTEWDHELKWIGSSLLAELHKWVVPSGNKDLFAYFGDGWQLAVPSSGYRYDMLAEDEMVYLFAHFAKHYRSGGIGCRHVLDLWVFQQTHPGLDQEKVRAELDNLYLGEFYDNICRLISVWFENGTTDEKTEFISDFIFASGSWGRMENKIASSGVKDQHGKSGGHRARWLYLLRHALPGVDALKNKYTILQKAPWMLPLVWIYRPFYKLLSKRERATLAKHKMHLQNLSPELVRTRQDALRYVGLDYHF